MNGELVSKLRTISDTRLIAGGAQRSLSGELFVTPEQKGSAQSEMKDTLYAHGIISKMDQETFLSFAMEFQYTILYYDEIKVYSHIHALMKYNNPLLNRYLDVNKKALAKRDEIICSPLYEIVYQEANRRFGMNLFDEGRRGWLEIETNDRNNITEAVKMGVESYMDRLKDKAYLDWEKPTVEGKPAKAKDTLTRYGIQGTFVGNDELLTAFHRRWNPDANFALKTV